MAVHDPNPFSGRPTGEVVSHDLQTWFASYLRICNTHRFGELDDFLAPELTVNGSALGRSGFVDGLRDLARGFPDYRWTLQQLAMSDGWLGAHCLGTGTHLGTFCGFRPRGVRVRTEEYTFYRVHDFRITALWSNGGRATVLDQLRGVG